MIALEVIYSVLKDLAGTKGGSTNNEKSLINRLSLFNSKKDSSLIKTTKSVEDESKRKNNLKSGLVKDKPCEIWETLAQQAKFVGNWSLCNLFWWDSCLYADRNVKAKSDSQLSKSPNAKPQANKGKKGLYFGDDKICSCCLSKLIIHYNFILVLNENQMDDVDSVNQEINREKEGFKELWEQYHATSEKYQNVFIAEKEESKAHKNILSIMDIQKEEFRQLISNEEKLTKEYEAKAQAYLDSDPLQAELESLELECGELQYELTKHNHEIRTQAIEIDQMRATVNSYNKSISRLTGSIRNSKNNSQDILQNTGSLRYEYKEKGKQDTILEASKGLEESNYYKWVKNDDNLFDSHDIKTATASKLNTTVTKDASHLFDRNSYCANSFSNKSLLVEGEDNDEDSLFYQRKRNHKLKNSNNCCEGPSCTII